MKKFIYTEKQFNSIINILNAINLSGVDNIRAMAMIFQLLESAEIDEEEGAE